jgi:hypothetical protein
MGDERGGDFTHNFNDKHMCPQRKHALWQETTHIHVEQPSISHNLMDNDDKKKL